MFDQPGSGNSATTHPPPVDRPLLREHESGFLDSFFNDPNNLDPTSLFSMSADAPNDSNNAFSNTEFDWLNQPVSDFDQSSSSLAATAAQANQHDWQNTGAGMQAGDDSGHHIQASADVYQAAGILHGNNSNVNRQHSNNAFAYAPDNAGAESNGFTYPPLNTSNSSNYYNTPSTATNPYSAMQQPRYSQAEVDDAYGQGYSNGSGERRRNVSLNFGTDDHFRTTIYEAASLDGPDKELADVISHNFANSERSVLGAAPPAPIANMRKRARPSQEGDVKDEDRSADDNEDDSRKRRRGQFKDEEDDAYPDGTYSRGKKGKRRPQPPLRTPSIPQEAPETPTQQQHQPPRVGGLARPTRENLSEEQKRSNHIMSEQKRRNLIKTGFDDITRMVPELRSGSLSKSNMLIEAGRFIRKMRDENRELEDLVGPIDKGG